MSAKNEEYGVSGCTKIGLARIDRFRDPMYLDIKDIDLSEERHVWCYNPFVGFIIMRIEDIKRIDNGHLYKYIFKNNCSIGKGSFGTEDNIIATRDQQIMLKNGESAPLMIIRNEDNVLGVIRKSFNETVYPCEANVIMSIRYYVSAFPSLCDDGIYSLSVGSDDCYYNANGMFVKGF